MLHLEAENFLIFLVDRYDKDIVVSLDNLRLQANAEVHPNNQQEKEDFDGCEHQRHQYFRDKCFHVKEAVIDELEADREVHAEKHDCQVVQEASEAVDPS